LAALTMASTSKRVMSPSTMVIRSTAFPSLPGVYQLSPPASSVLTGRDDVRTS
jgi:hypothetical protein